MLRRISYLYGTADPYSRAVQFLKPYSFKAFAFILFIATLAGRPAAALANAPEASPAAAALAVAPDELTADALYVRQWALESGDTRRQPFAVVDKRAARLFVFNAEGHLVGATPVLLGQGPGDHSVQGVADGDLNSIPIADRTTPAGRFASQPGRNLNGEAIVWLDYHAALAIHRVRPGASQAGRMARLASAGANDKRASLGCVVVPPAFYDTVVAPTLGRQRGVVYVLPERQPVQAMFGPGATVAGGH